jgi:hypothetical protein
VPGVGIADSKNDADPKGQRHQMRPLHSKQPRTKLADAHKFRKDGHYSSGGEGGYLTDEERHQIVDDVHDLLRDITKKHFPKTGKLEYAVLKAHLIIENVLAQYIRCTSFVLVEPEELNFTFRQKLEIAVLHGFGNGCPITVPSVELLNKVRNQIAHTFTFDKNLVDEMIRVNADDEVDCKKLTDRERVSFLRRWCYYVCGRMSGELGAYVKLTSKGTLWNGG